MKNNYNNDNNNDYSLILHSPSSIALGAILNALDGIGADVFSSWVRSKYLGDIAQLDKACVRRPIDTLSDMGYDRLIVKHLISVGGLDASHPDTSNTAMEYYDAFNDDFNQENDDGLLL